MKKLAIAFGYQIDCLNYSRLIKDSILELSINEFDIVAITTFDNNSYEVLFNEEIVDKFLTTPRFLEFESLAYALKRYGKFYDCFLYVNCSIFSKHIVRSIDSAIQECLQDVMKSNLPCLSGRIDLSPLTIKGTSAKYNSNYVSTFFLLFNKAGSSIILSTLNNFTHRLLDTEAFDFNHLAVSIQNKLLEKNKTYRQMQPEIIILKRNSCLIERLISYEVGSQGELIMSKVLNSFGIRILELLKYYLFKRIIYIRPILRLL